MWKHVAANGLTFLTVVLFLIAGAITWGVSQYTAEGPLEQAICLRVASGSNMTIVGEDLVEQGAISSQTVFSIGVDYSGKASQLKAGSFLVPTGVSMEGIVDIVTRGGASTCGTQVVYSVGIGRIMARVQRLDPARNEFIEIARFNVFEDDAPTEYSAVLEEPDTQFAVQVIEGTTVWQVVSALNELDILGDDLSDFPAEGMLAPDQYEFSPGASVNTLVSEMVSRQVAILSEAWARRADGIPLATADDALILASIIEKETGIPEERPEVASVFINRLNQGIRLQTDPTVIYGVTGGRGVLGRGLRQSELRSDTAWNTYVIDGLPSTPIANPGREAIEAALHPAETDFIFFVADGTGGHAFSVTLDEHNANVARWRVIEAERAASSGN